MTKDPKRLGVTIALVATLIQVVALTAQTPRIGRPIPKSVPHDWSHRHLIFSAPTSIDHARKLQQDPRYWHQYLRRHAAASRNVSHKSNVSVPVVPPDNDAIHRDWGMSLGNKGTVGDEMFPAKFSFDVNATPSCTNDFVVFNTSLAGSSTKPSIVAFNQLYSTQGSVGGLCNQDGSSVMWAYNTNAAGNTRSKTVTSSVLSLDGTQVAYVDSDPSGTYGAVLHILKWRSGQGTVAAPVAPDQIVSAWSSCTAGNSCIVNIAFNGAQPDTNSAPFYDYTRDALYVGDDNGVLHKFAPVLVGTPQEVTSGGWPITVDSGARLSSPVFDSGSGNIFVGDSTGLLSYVLDVNSTVGFCASGVAPCLGTPSQPLGGAIVDAPLVDSSAGSVFAFDGTDGNNGSVYQFDTALSVASQVTVNVGGTGGGSNIHAGAFDNTYMNSANGTGYLFVCGKDGANTDRPAIHRITITNQIMNSVSDGSLTLVSANNEECSPVTEIFNTTSSTDWIFFSVGKAANQIAAGCSTTAGSRGCLMALNLTNLGGAWPPAAVDNGYPVPNSVAYGASTSGIVVDNVADPTTYPQASSIYFTFARNAVAAAACNGATGVGCAVKLTQSGLQ